MAIHPIDFRYGRPAMRAVWDEEARLKNLLAVEVALAQAHAEVGNISGKEAQKIASGSKRVRLKRVKEIERKINHDLMAVVKALSEKSGSGGKYVHLGATSYDIVDTALALQLKESCRIIESDLETLKRTLLSLSRKTKNLVCIGRTHGQHALPTTYGLRFAIWAAEVGRHLSRLDQLKPRLLTGKMNGAVGTGAAFGSKAGRIQSIVTKKLRLNSVLASNQVVQRDRHAEFLLFLALVAETLNKIAVNIRTWQRTEIGEVEEGFGGKQVGSSTMPHKRNPIYCERISGLSRIITSNALVALRNIPLWDERDLTNSSPERVIFPEACVLMDYLLDLSSKSLSNLRFNRGRIKQNLGMTNGLVMAERIMIELTKNGICRQGAHELVREIAMRCYSNGQPFGEALKKNKKISSKLAPKEIDQLMDPATYLGNARQQVDLILRRLK